MTMAAMIKPEPVEPLLNPTEDRFILFPIKHPDIWQMYEKHVAVFWTPEEIDLSNDYKDFCKLTENEQHFIKYVLAFFASSDMIVNENLCVNFCNEIQFPEARFFYQFQMAIENIHQHTYSSLIDTYIKNQYEKVNLFNAIKTVPCVRKKATWAYKYMDKKNASFPSRLVAFAVFEGVFFSGSFCAIFWLKKRGLMPGLTFSNELISRDEGLHCSFACLLYRNHLIHKLSHEEVYSIVDDAIQIESEFIEKSLPVSLIGMNSKLMLQYIKFCADRLLGDLDVPKLYNETNPFDWMDMISMDGKTNFFEKRVGEYSKAGVGIESSKQKITFDEEF